MEHEEFDKIVRLAKAAFDATQKAKAAYDAYENAASNAYAAEAHATAKAVYEHSIASGNFESTFIDNINHDFNNSFRPSASAYSSAPTQTPVHTPQPSISIDNTNGYANETTHDNAETSVVKPLRDLFTMEYEDEDKKSDDAGGWQSRG